MRNNVKRQAQLLPEGWGLWGPGVSSLERLFMMVSGRRGAAILGVHSSTRLGHHSKSGSTKHMVTS